MLSPFLTLDCSVDEASQWSSRKLHQKGLRVLQTFDLHTAREMLKECPCPYHGTCDCDCQMLVLLVYGKTAQPATLILHGSSGQTWISFPDSVLQPVDPKLVKDIQRTLETGSAPIPQIK